MSLIASALSVFGILFVVRTLVVFRARALVPESTLTWIGVITLASFGLVPYFAPTSPPWRAAGAVAFGVLAPFALHACERRKLAACKARVPLFIDQWILNLRLGASVTTARDRALADEHADLRALLRPIFDAAADERRPHVLLSPPVVRELGQIGRASHAVLERLEGLRGGLRDVADFRRKSGQAVRQAAIQASVMVVMLIALSIFTVRRYGWADSGGYVTTAAALSVVGAFVMLRMARKTTWKL